MNNQMDRFIVAKPLNIPQRAASGQGVVTLDVNGSSFCGKWTFSVVANHGLDNPQKVGELTIDIAPMTPLRAISYLKDWITTECMRLGAILLRFDHLTASTDAVNEATLLLRIKLPTARG